MQLLNGFTKFLQSLSLNKNESYIVQGILNDIENNRLKSISLGQKLTITYYRKPRPTMIDVNRGHIIKWLDHYKDLSEIPVLIRFIEKK